MSDDGVSAGLRLAAMDADDLQVLSAHLQDAVLKVGDIRYLAAECKFVMVVNRFDWVNHDRAAKAAKDEGIRKRTGLHFDQVTAVRSKKIRQGAPDAVLSLLSIDYEAGQTPPEGQINLVFAGGGIVTLDVECVEARLQDLGEAWQTASVPHHEDDN